MDGWMHRHRMMQQQMLQRQIVSFLEACLCRTITYCQPRGQRADAWGGFKLSFFESHYLFLCRHCFSFTLLVYLLCSLRSCSCSTTIVVTAEFDLFFRFPSDRGREMAEQEELSTYGEHPITNHHFHLLSTMSSIPTRYITRITLLRQSHTYCCVLHRIITITIIVSLFSPTLLRSTNHQYGATPYKLGVFFSIPQQSQWQPPCPIFHLPPLPSPSLAGSIS